MNRAVRFVRGAVVAVKNDLTRGLTSLGLSKKQITIVFVTGIVINELMGLGSAIALFHIFIAQVKGML
jgi:hypothetical protein